MIRIHRPATVPVVLQTDGVARRREHEAEVNAASAASVPVTLTFDPTIYGHARVKDTLIAMQRSKCAFCEAKPLHVSSGDVEHFRPKGAVRQSDDEPLQRPGYYWLAYDWTNLLFACERCNRRHKKSLFPLVDPSQRATTPRAPISDEDPVFIDPAAEDPEPYIAYREHMPIAIADNHRGRQTIDALGLRRPELSSDREEHLERLKILDAVRANPAVPEHLRSQADALIAKSTAPTAEYSLMCRSVFPALVT